jgi:hypothetical protein
LIDREGKQGRDGADAATDGLGKIGSQVALGYQGSFALVIGLSVGAKPAGDPEKRVVCYVFLPIAQAFQLITMA